MTDDKCLHKCFQNFDVLGALLDMDMVEQSLRANLTSEGNDYLNKGLKFRRL
jgi:hypothetical protein